MMIEVPDRYIEDLETVRKVISKYVGREMSLGDAVCFLINPAKFYQEINELDIYKFSHFENIIVKHLKKLIEAGNGRVKLSDLQHRLSPYGIRKDDIMKTLKKMEEQNLIVFEKYGRATYIRWR